MPFEYEIRPAITDDADAISAMITRSYSELLKPDYNPRILAKALPRIGKARPELLITGTYFVAESENGDILGAGGWTDISPTRGLGIAGEGHMRHVAVDPSHLRRGIAGALAAAAFASARDSGVTCLRCMSTLTAEPFYERMGFETVQPIELTLEPGLFFPAIEMRRRLN
ncbi:GNAT family N-acetyltransferase [Cognatishimia activa]|uniref:Putative acyltransferase n=1 Tax=Cognatishimia activa TaxID=1715691 RepID=A0A0P1ITL1_9RHOB|nr:GNAT family N-acetyltransferase [Cognatishimia activa]MEE2945683.1 GNAT family N-acetyltransferase [Pseudomonadota bacterium]CUI77583.1 putative acyltransferase [Cognatishimia activa]CUK26783.1 putative acyltransferase [Cognatishimia activa]